MNFSLKIAKRFMLGGKGSGPSRLTGWISIIGLTVGSMAMIISISMILTMIVAGLFGILVPITLKKMDIDPAIASSVFVTTITDVIGFVSFLGVGAYFL